MECVENVEDSTRNKGPQLLRFYIFLQHVIIDCTVEA